METRIVIPEHFALDPRAVAAFDEKARGLRATLQPLPGYRADAPAGGTITRLSGAEPVPLGLAGEQYAGAAAFVRRLSQRREIASLVSEGFILDSLFGWFELTCGSGTSGDSFIEALHESAQKEVRPRRVATPVEYFTTQRPLQLGDVHIHQLPTDFFSRMADAAARAAPDRSEELRTQFGELHERYALWSFAEITVEAEGRRARERVLEQVSRAIVVLRFFSPAAFAPWVESYFGIRGRAHVPSTDYFEYEGDWPTIHSSVATDAAINHYVDDRTYPILEASHFSYLSGIMMASSEDQLRDVLWRSLHFFDRAIRATVWSEKLVWACAAMDVLLLDHARRDDSVVEAASRRLAVLYTLSTPDELQEMKGHLVGAYEARSAYLHHGRTFDEHKDGNRKILWKTFLAVRSVINNAFVLMDRRSLTTHAELLDYLERRHPKE